MIRFDQSYSTMDRASNFSPRGPGSNPTLVLFFCSVLTFDVFALLRHKYLLFIANFGGYGSLYSNMSTPKLPKPSCWSHIWWRCLWNVEWNIMEEWCCPVTSKGTWTISGRSRGGQGVIYNFSHLFHAYLSHPDLQMGLRHDREACEFPCS
jgi:hypothetical protein